jgi:carbon monoxide dehydrogenase subunit G
MELKGQQRIAAPRQKVWQSLNDPNVLKACIPGCESLTQDGDSAFDAVVRAKVGPVRAKFSGRVELSDIRPPESYRISGQGKGGAAGVAKGSAQVSLANKYATDFFARFGDIVTGAVPLEALAGEAPVPAKAAAPAVTAAAPPAAADANTAHLRRLNWALLALVAVLIGYILATH